jgi:hypothetical protein
MDGEKHRRPLSHWGVRCSGKHANANRAVMLERGKSYKPGHDETQRAHDVPNTGSRDC